MNIKELRDLWDEVQTGRHTGPAMYVATPLVLALPHLLTIAENARDHHNHGNLNYRCPVCAALAALGNP